MNSTHQSSDAGFHVAWCLRPMGRVLTPADGTPSDKHERSDLRAEDRSARPVSAAYRRRAGIPAPWARGAISHSGRLFRSMVPLAHEACIHAADGTPSDKNERSVLQVEDRSARAVSAAYRRRAGIPAPWARGAMLRKNRHLIVSFGLRSAFCIHHSAFPQAATFGQRRT
jgi:hypothetical protein